MKNEKTKLKKRGEVGTFMLWTSRITNKVEENMEKRDKITVEEKESEQVLKMRER